MLETRHKPFSYQDARAPVAYDARNASRTELRYLSEFGLPLRMEESYPRAPARGGHAFERRRRGALAAVASLALPAAICVAVPEVWPALGLARFLAAARHGLQRGLTAAKSAKSVGRVITTADTA